MPARSPAFEQAREFLARGQPGRAQAACGSHLSACPDDADGWHLLAHIQIALQTIPAAGQSLQRALALRPELRADPAFDRSLRTVEAILLTMAGLAHKQEGRLSEARPRFERAAGLLPEEFWPQHNLGELEMDFGDVPQAIGHFRRAAAERTSHSNLLLALLHDDRATPAEILEEHRQWVARHAPPVGAAPTIAEPDPARPIRLGYSSPDLRSHPVPLFLEAVLAHHDKARFQVTCYADGGCVDDVTRRLQGYGHRWVESGPLGFEPLMARIRADRIDILIDLAVHSGFNRQRLFAARPAPIQMTWLGYAGTTGSPSIDYRITDGVVDPPGLTEAHFTEELLRLPEVLWSFMPSPETPPVRESSSGDNGDSSIRFGTATRLAKISPSCLEAWAALLRATPRATLHLAAKPFADAVCVAHWRQKFVERGVAPERVELRADFDYRGYLEFLGSLDVGLDTFPFNGGTTVCQTLWMGTPVVALAGATSRARVTASMLHAIGRQDWVAEDVDVWIALNRRLAEAPAERRVARSQLRDWIRASSLGDAARFTRQYEEALRSAFARRIRGSQGATPASHS